MTVKGFIHKEKFVAISVTGTWCELQCKHCRASFLRGMISAPSGEKLWDILSKLYARGVRGALISGGFTKNGVLPLKDDLVEVLVNAKRRYGFIFNIHPGLIQDRNSALTLKEFADVIDFEFTLSSYIVQEVRGLSYEPLVYVKSIELLVDVGLDVVPHIFLWHPCQSDEMLIKELHIVRNLGIDRITLLVLIPKYLEATLPSIDKLLRAVEKIRKVFDGEIYLGCMRPQVLKRKLDVELVLRGLIDRIANPSPIVMNHISEVYDACCSLPADLLNVFKIR